MFVDEAEIIIKGGKGGSGKVSFHKPPQKGPDGGNGGDGGDVYLNGISDLTALRSFTSLRIFKAKDGGMGGSNKKFGGNGEDLEIFLPLGSLLQSSDTKEEVEILKVNQRILICKGGKGGKGNYEFRSSVNTTPKFAQTGQMGQEKRFRITLKLIARIGLVGSPNAGKTSLLNELTRSSAKVGDYPFTTLEPNLGVFNGKTLADIPGLIEGAHMGRGLGIKFLKHVEKVKILLFLISADSEDVISNYKTLKNELEAFNPELLQKKEIILLTKSDLFTKPELKKKINDLKTIKKKAVPISIYDWDSIENLKKIISKS